MDRIKHMWILLSNDSAYCCNEPQAQGMSDKENVTMDPVIFTDLTEQAEHYKWNCSIVTDKKGIPQNLYTKLNNVNYRIIIPADYDGDSLKKEATIVFTPKQVSLNMGPSKGKALLRVSHGDLETLATSVISLLERYKDVSLRHPDLLMYTQDDLKKYQQQLYEVAGWLLGKGPSWTDYRIDVLTRGFELANYDECGAGDKNLTVGPEGNLYFCPAAYRAGWKPCGHISKVLEIPNRHLFTRHYALPCREKCNAMHCSRCVFLHKLSTLEYNVPSKNACKMAHIELECQAQLASRAVEQKLWNNPGWRIPEKPVIDDPFDLVKVEEEVPEVMWNRLQLFNGNPDELSPSMMLDIILGLQVRLLTIKSCVKSGYVVPTEMVKKNVLLYLRRKTTEKYKRIVFKEGLPTVFEIELMMYRLIETIANEKDQRMLQESSNISL